MAIIGTCSRCHGPVETPDVWHGTHAPPRRCRDCGAQGKENYGPLIDMVPRPGHYPHWRYQPTYTIGDLFAFNTTGTSAGATVTYDQIQGTLLK